MTVRERVTARINQNVPATVTVALVATVTVFMVLTVLLAGIPGVWWVVTGVYVLVVTSLIVILARAHHLTRDFKGDRLRDEVRS